MTHLTAHRNGVLCLLAVVAVAGCATRLNVSSGTGAVAPVSATAAATSSAPPSPGSAALTQQVNSIDRQLSAIDGQINAGNAGLSANEGDPAQ
jgi:hypothetical protein